MARVLGRENSKQSGLDGSRVYEYFLAGRHQEIADYYLRDVDPVRSIYRRIRFISSITES
jgi:predicted PolB exonuclease-like 3'-5' exonuclease